MRRFRSAVLALAAITALAPPAPAQDYPTYRELYVNDFADLLSPAEEDGLRAMLMPLRDTKGIEFTVVTIRRMADHGHLGPIEPFATGLFNTWGVGDAARNNGVMLLVAQDDRVLRIELGSGYGSSMDAAMKQIIDEGIVPRFRREQYAEGIERGVRLVIRELTGSYPSQGGLPVIERVKWAVQDLWEWLGAWIFAIIGPLMILPYQAFRRWRRNRPRHCPVDGSRMARLPEGQDDTHLAGGQQTEERLGSVDYDVWHCARCNHVTVEAYKAWFSGYGACRACGFRTLQGTTTIIRAATTASEGEKRIDYHCQNCQIRYSVTQTIPRRHDSSSSGSSGSSFGGGSSSGGGASGKW